VVVGLLLFVVFFSNNKNKNNNKQTTTHTTHTKDVNYIHFFSVSIILIEEQERKGG